MPIVDLAQNPLALPAGAQAFGFDPTGLADVPISKLYSYLIEGLRQSDRRTLFLRRFLEGQEQLGDQLTARIQDLDTLRNVFEIEDEYIRFLAAHLGWTGEYKEIIDGLSDDDVRRLTASSIDLWANRGKSGSYTQALNAILGAVSWELDWFDTRWVLGENAIAEDLQGNDIWFLGSSAPYETYLQIEDPTRSFSPETILQIVSRWRPSGERVLITTVEVLDRFNADRVDVWRTISDGSIIANDIGLGALSLTDDAVIEHAVAIAVPVLELSDYALHARMDFAGVAGWLGVFVRHDGTDPLTACEIRLDPFASPPTLGAYIGGALIGTEVDVLDFPPFEPGDFHTFRVTCLDLSATDVRLTVYINGTQVYSQVHSGLLLAKGSAGVAHGVGLQAFCSDFEMTRLPADFIKADINA